MTRAAPIAALVGLTWVTGCVLAYEARTSEVGAGGSGGVVDGSGSTAGAGSGSTSRETAAETDGVIACAADQAVCSNTCVDLEEHPDHCGDCGIVCGLGEACDGAECRDGCRNGEIICDRYCVDVSLDEEHCGGCGNACGPGVACVDDNCGAQCEPECDRERERCADGTCVCRPGLTDCGGTCVDLERDPQHCGQCDRDCGGDACGDGDCVPPECTGFADACSGSCTDVEVDPLHCGQCGEPCDALQTCIMGECEGT